MNAVWDPDEGNVLASKLNPIRSPDEIIGDLVANPVFPEGIEEAPPHIRLHYLMRLRELHVPSQPDQDLWRTIELMVRENYRGRDPRLNTTWADISGEVPLLRSPVSPPLAASVGGPSGSGKSQGVLRCLRGCLGAQFHIHDSFPGLHGPVLQLVYLCVEVPPSGKASDLALALMKASKRATGTDRFDRWLAMQVLKQPMQALEEWHQWAVSHFLGILHLDEVQNFFKLQSLKQRLTRTGTSGEPELSVREDQAIRWFLSIVNKGQYAVLASGTNDGINALGHRFSTLSRLTSMGYHGYKPFRDAEDPAFFLIFLPPLIACQLTRKKLELTPDLAALIFQLTAGVQRIIVTLWFAAQRVALSLNHDELRFEHLRHASQTLLAPLAPAVAALLSDDPNKLRLYEDFVRAVDPSIWIASSSPTP